MITAENTERFVKEYSIEYILCEKCEYVNKAIKYKTFQCTECGHFHNRSHPSLAA